MPLDNGFLVDRFALFYAHSVEAARDYLLRNPPEIEDPQIVGIGGYQLDLSSVRQELRLLEDAFPSHSRRILMGSNLGKSEVVSALSDARYLHLATHGVELDTFADPVFHHKDASDEKTQVRDIRRLTKAEDSSDLRRLVSALRLSPKENGFLRASEIAALDLPAELVVLSACRTSLGTMTRSQDVVDEMRRAFLDAGVRTCISTRWRVRDSIAERVWRSFYSNLKGSGPSEALALSLRTIKNNDPDIRIFDWSAFYLTGNWRPRVSTAYTPRPAKPEPKGAR